MSEQKEFEVAIANLENFLISRAEERYFVVTHSKQNKNAVAVQKGDKSRMVQVFYAGGSFDKATSSPNSETTHNAVASVRLTVSEAATADLATLNNPASTPEQLLAAMQGVAVAEANANKSIDSLFGIMFDLIMGANGDQFGQDWDSSDYSIADRWGRDFNKDIAVKRGSLVTVNGQFDVEFTVKEIPEGDDPLADSFTVTGNIDIQDGAGDELIIETEHNL